jgi:hypothetical protein
MGFLQRKTGGAFACPSFFAEWPVSPYVGLSIALVVLFFVVHFTVAIADGDEHLLDLLRFACSYFVAIDFVWNAPSGIFGVAKYDAVFRERRHDVLVVAPWGADAHAVIAADRLRMLAT